MHRAPANRSAGHGVKRPFSLPSSFGRRRRAEPVAVQLPDGPGGEQEVSVGVLQLRHRDRGRGQGGQEGAHQTVDSVQRHRGRGRGGHVQRGGEPAERLVPAEQRRRRRLLRRRERAVPSADCRQTRRLNTTGRRRPVTRTQPRDRIDKIPVFP